MTKKFAWVAEIGKILKVPLGLSEGGGGEGLDLTDTLFTESIVATSTQLSFSFTSSDNIIYKAGILEQYQPYGQFLLPVGTRF